MVDSRDDRIYRTVKIGSQIWMAQNLAYKPEKGKYWCYINKDDYLSEFGYVYRWKTAVENDICPCGWRLPTIEDYEILLYNFDGPGLEAHLKLIPAGNSGFNGIGSYFRAEVKWVFGALFWTAEKGIAFSVGIPNRNYYAGFGSWIPMGGLPIRCIKDE